MIICIFPFPHTYLIVLDIIQTTIWYAWATRRLQPFLTPPAEISGDTQIGLNSNYWERREQDFKPMSTEKHVWE